MPGGGGRPLVSRIADRINGISEAVLFGLIATMIVVTTLQVICRFCFEALSWSEELTRFLLVFASLLGAAIAFRRGSHMAVTFVARRLPEGLQKILGVAVHLLGVLFFAVVVWYGARMMATEAGQATPAMGLSMSWLYAFYPLVGGIILLHLAAGILETVRGR